LPSAGPTSAYPILRTPASICFTASYDRIETGSIAFDAPFDADLIAGTVSPNIEYYGT
jgi:hypothetical protein